MRALVTGGAGFIGSNIVDALVARGDDVAVIDDLSAGKRENLAGALGAGARLHVVDIREADDVRAAFAQEQPEVVLHLAAQTDVRKSIADPAFDARTNVVGTLNVLEAARTHGARRFINTSTGGAIYGDVDQIPTPESVPPEPMAPYGQSKFCAEEYCRWERRLHGLETVTVRYGNVYGPRQDPHGDAGVIAIFCGRALEGRRPTVYGDGRQTRDYVHVDDIVAANLLAADHPDADGAYNVGNQQESTVLDLVEAIRDAAGLGQEFDPEFAPARQGELDRSCLDITRIRTELGFEPKVGLREGIAQTYAWVRAGS
ncbi:MAG TPA: NAD-dependent epimerase/dehydratase family protein [Baekduia sp.]|nr:NAD-dependent epimerase/dehydratase family protein [Baekduia sp.]